MTMITKQQKCFASEYHFFYHPYQGVETFTINFWICYNKLASRFFPGQLANWAGSCFCLITTRPQSCWVERRKYQFSFACMLLPGWQNVGEIHPPASLSEKVKVPSLTREHRPNGWRYHIYFRSHFRSFLKKMKNDIFDKKSFSVQVLVTFISPF